jgi:hypothetical protein
MLIRFAILFLSLGACCSSQAAPSEQQSKSAANYQSVAKDNQKSAPFSAPATHVIVSGNVNVNENRNPKDGSCDSNSVLSG